MEYHLCDVELKKYERVFRSLLHWICVWVIVRTSVPILNACNFHSFAFASLVCAMCMCLCRCKYMFSVSVSRILKLQCMWICGLGWAAPHSLFFPSYLYLSQGENVYDSVCFFVLLLLLFSTSFALNVCIFFSSFSFNIFHFTLFPLLNTPYECLYVCVCVPFYFCRLFALPCSCCFGIANTKRKPANASLCFSHCVCYALFAFFC